MATTTAPTVTPTTDRLPAWTRLMTSSKAHDARQFPQGATVEQAMSIAGLTGWDVTKADLQVRMPNGVVEEFDPRMATVRRTAPGADTWSQIAEVGPDYPVIQNEEAFTFATAVLDVIGREAHVEAAGILGKRSERAFLSIRVPDHLTITNRQGGTDPVDTFLTVITGHNGRTSLSLMAHPMRLACTNMLPLITRTASTYRVRHVGDATGRVQEAREALGVAFTSGDEWTEAMHGLLEKEMTDRQFAAMVQREFLPLAEDAKPATADRVQAQRATLQSLFTGSPTTEFGRGTRYAAFQAVTEWQEWGKPRNPFAEGTTESLLAGQGANARQRAYAVLAG